MANCEALDDLPDGAGCAEVWQHLSEKRNAERSDHAEDCPGPPECDDASYCTPQRFWG